MASQLVSPHDVLRLADGALPFKSQYGRPSHPFDKVPAWLIERTSLGIGSGFAYGFTGSDFPNHPGPTVGASPYYMGGWVVNMVGTGASFILTDGGGSLVVKPGNTDEDNTNITRTAEEFRYSATSGKKTVFAVRFAMEDVDVTDLYLGLAIRETPQINIAASALDITDGIAFWKAATATAVNFIARKDSVSSSVTSGVTMTDGTTYVLAFSIDSGVISAYEGTTLNNMTLLTTIAAGAANIPEDEDLAVSLTVGAEGTGTKYVAFKDLLFWQER